MNETLKTILITVGVIAALLAVTYGGYRAYNYAIYSYNVAVDEATAKIKQGVKEGVEEGVAGGVGKMLNPLKLIGV